MSAALVLESILNPYARCLPSFRGRSKEAVSVLESSLFPPLLLFLSSSHFPTPPHCRLVASIPVFWLFSSQRGASPPPPGSGSLPGLLGLPECQPREWCPRSGSSPERASLLPQPTSHECLSPPGRASLDRTGTALPETAPPPAPQFILVPDTERVWAGRVLALGTQG